MNPACDPSNDRQWIGIRQAAALAECSVSKVQNWVIYGKVRSISPPDRTSRLYSAVDIRALAKGAHEMLASA